MESVDALTLPLRTGAIIRDPHFRSPVSQRSCFLEFGEIVDLVVLRTGVIPSAVLLDQPREKAAKESSSNRAECC